MSEDTLFMIDYTNKVKRIGVVDELWYNYYINDYSISNGTKKEKLEHNINEFIEEIEKRMNKDENKSLKKSYQARIDKANNAIRKL